MSTIETPPQIGHQEMLDCLVTPPHEDVTDNPIRSSESRYTFDRRTVTAHSSSDDGEYIR